jgi:transcriptional regulator with XRE-family HTH domain
MDEISKRFTEFYKTLGIKQIEFCEIAKVNKSVLSNIVCDNPIRNISYIMIIKIKRAYPTLNLNWLIFNQGEMFISPSHVAEDSLTIRMMLEKIEALTRENQDLRRQLKA